MNAYFVPWTVCSDAEANIKAYDIIPVHARHDIILLGKEDKHTQRKKKEARSGSSTEHYIAGTILQAGRP